MISLLILFGALLALGLLATSLEQIEQGTATTLLSTELNSLTNNSLASSTVGGSSGLFTNTQATGNFNGYTRAKMELRLAAPGGTLTSGSSINIWFCKSVDGSNYEDGYNASVTPARAPDVVFPVNASSAAQRIVRMCWLPVGTWYVLFQNAGTGQTLAASGNTVKVLPSTDQGV